MASTWRSQSEVVAFDYNTFEGLHRDGVIQEKDKINRLAKRYGSKSLLYIILRTKSCQSGCSICSRRAWPSLGLPAQENPNPPFQTLEDANRGARAIAATSPTHRATVSSMSPMVTRTWDPILSTTASNQCHQTQSHQLRQSPSKFEDCKAKERLL